MEDELAALKQQKTTKGKKKKNHTSFVPKPPDVLDDGYFGRGIYFTMYSDYA